VHIRVSVDCCEISLPAGYIALTGRQHARSGGGDRARPRRWRLTGAGVGVGVVNGAAAPRAAAPPL